jgi:prepilin-type N-terminal cleavage/methylation domain-containing protein/prepilin-type processing-associated H-X9-DG protein
MTGIKRARRRRGGFSLAELLVVTGIVAILVAILLPYLEKVREQARRQTCADNLNAINRALRAYANLNKNFYPRTIYESAAHPIGYSAFSGADSLNPFTTGTTVAPNDVTASLWLLVREGFAQPRLFVCPSTSDETDPMTTGGQRAARENRSNFTSGHFLSYSYASPFSNAKGYVLDDTQPADFALMADKNPGAAGATGPPYDASEFALARANSPNHFQAGQNVLYADGHVSFQTTPYCGVGVADRRDNIYSARASRPSTQPSDPLPPPESNGVGGHDVGPAAATDSYLVPTKDD